MIKLSFKTSIFLLLFSLVFANTLYAQEKANTKQSAEKKPVLMIKHLPFAKKDCGACHTDKDGKSGKLIIDGADLCFKCHDSYEKNDFIHGPVAAGACLLCHNPHESENPKLLNNKNINNLCVTCHSDKNDMLNSGDEIHPPVEDSCINCHDPHAQKHKFQLKADRKKDLCFMCHTDKKDRVENSKNKHGAIEMGDKCLGCHDPHSSPAPKLLKADDSKAICLTCHSASLPRDEDGKMLMNMGEHLANNPDAHGPVMWGDCAACHNPHGSDNTRILKYPFPEKSAIKFTADGYLCFKCHEPKKMTEKFTTEFTDFRNGEKNTHFLHVKTKRISCKTCHDYHASKDLPHHLKSESTFGSAKFSLRYIETPTGGSCNPICHTRRYYDRVDPVNVRSNKPLKKK